MNVQYHLVGIHFFVFSGQHNRIPTIYYRQTSSSYAIKTIRIAGYNSFTGLSTSLASIAMTGSARGSDLAYGRFGKVNIREIYIPIIVVADCLLNFRVTITRMSA